MPPIYTNPLQPLPDRTSTDTTESAAAELKLLVDAEILRIHVGPALQGSTELFRFGDPQPLIVSLIERSNTTVLKSIGMATDATMTLIMIPHHSGVESGGLIQQIQAWVEDTSPMNSMALTPPGQIKSVLLTLQGIHLVWQPDRAVVIAEPQRMDIVCKSLIEATFFEQELRRIEAGIDLGWERTKSDSKFAFEFNERDVPEKQQLSQRFQEILELRIRLARLTPQILVPHVYPPTIASQIGERLRERTRMPERLELVDEKLSAQERVYDHCSQRAGEYLVARKGHLLEWIIIILLFIQTMLWIVDLLSSMSE
jgi:hypothetical protein